MDFNRIRQFPRAHYEVDIQWRFLENHLEKEVRDFNLDLNPDFQRGHVWSREQQAAYVEYILKGGEHGKVLVFNNPGFPEVSKDYVIVDGLQRLTAVRHFLSGNLKAFGFYRNEFTGEMRYQLGFKWRILALPTRADVLAFYLGMNTGGTPHTETEIARVKELLLKENSSGSGKK